MTHAQYTDSVPAETRCKQNKKRGFRTFQRARSTRAMPELLLQHGKVAVFLLCVNTQTENIYQLVHSLCFVARQWWKAQRVQQPDFTKRTRLEGANHDLC